MKGIFAVYKPKGPTSFDIIRQIKKFVGKEKVGHAGTLDPRASGVLVVGVGREATKKLGEIVAKEKEYIAEIKLGETSSTDDEEGEKQKMEAKKIPAEGEIYEAIESFIGEIRQTPPIYSAVKIAGRSAYQYARRGEIVSLKSRPVTIKSIKILEYRWPFLKLKIITGAGVYIRALARDLGKKLKTGGYLADLERTRVGQFNKAAALAAGDLEDQIKAKK